MQVRSQNLATFHEVSFVNLFVLRVGSIVTRSHGEMEDVLLGRLLKCQRDGDAATCTFLSFH